MKLTEYDESLIVSNITHAKDKKKQLTIEAQLNAISRDKVKEILKKHGVSMKIFNGGSHKKKDGIEVGLGEDNKGESWTPAADENGKDWQDLAIPPVEVECEILTDVQDIPAKEAELSEQAETAADRPREIKDINTEDALIVGTHILEDDKIFEAIQKKFEKMKARRRGLIAEIERIDTCLRKYAHFYEDIYQEIDKEGVEL